MINKCEDNLDIPFYINSKEGVFRFNLYSVEPDLFIKRLRATTVCRQYQDK